MKNTLTIVRREFASYYTSPIGYIFMIVFLVISVGLYMTSFFVFPTADMRGFFGNLPVLLCVFIPAVTMRAWAEERKENTWEMLLTFPMKARELVLGKFLATLIFYSLTLAATFTVPLMLAVLGNPDGGAVFGGYLGALVLGALFLSIGIFFSGFCKDQIVAFVVTLLASFALFLLGTQFIASYLDGMVAGLGSLLSRLVGVIDHYNAFTRGVVELGDVLYFVVWTTLFLVLNVMYLDERSRPKARATFASAVVLSVGVGLAFNGLVAGQSLARFDMTEDKIYTVSPASKEILSGLDTPVQVRLYITPESKMPTALKSLEQDICDKLDELSVASDGNFNYSTVYLEAANVVSEPDTFGAEEDEEEEKDEAEIIEERMLDKGVRPFSVQAMGEDQVTQQLIYSSIEVAYRDKAEEIIPQILPQNLDELEYRLVSTIYKLTRDKQPIVALAAPKSMIPPEQLRMLQQMGQQVPPQDDPYEYLEQILRYEKYDVQRVDLTKESPLPAEYDVLVIVNPSNYSERQRWEIARALRSGKPVMLAVQNYKWNYRVERRAYTVSKMEESPQLNELLDAYGLGIDDDILMDVNHVPLQLSGGNPLAQLFGLGQSFNLPIQIEVTSDTMNPEVSITNRLSRVFYLWGSALDIHEDKLKENGLNCQVLMSTSDQAWKIPADTKPTSTFFERPGEEGKQHPLMALVEGQFPDPYEGKDRPAWPEEPPAPGQPPTPPTPEEEAAAPITPAPGKLILAGCAEMWRREFFTQDGNMDLFINSVDALALGDQLVHIRARKPIDRAIVKPGASQRTFWKVVNYGMVSSLIAAVGIVTAVYRRRSRNAYTMSYAGAE
jgi:ABC-2 type transport system permease protein